jgi:glucose/arabinose dehydrogenase
MENACCVLVLVLCGYVYDAAQAQVGIQEAYPLLDFDRAVEVVPGPHGSSILYVVEQPGRIWAIDNSATPPSKDLFADVSSSVSCCGELGLRGLAFHPLFPDSAYAYLNYTSPGPNTVIARFELSSSNPAVVDPASEIKLLEFSQPYQSHNGGKVAFGPDGYLYVSVGDGGSPSDLDGNGQDVTNLYGSILRIDVDRQEAGRPYGIPTGNPFYGSLDGTREEIYAYGLRNPWRFSFDRSGRLWVADVGARDWEEINWVSSGDNLGWSVMEGDECHQPGCSVDGLKTPAFAYSHENGDRSITGGYVYAGENCDRALEDKYIFGDYVSGRIWAAEFDGSGVYDVRLLNDAPYRFSTFGLDTDGELLMVAYDNRGGASRLYSLDCSPLAVELASFDAVLDGSDILLLWSTLTEVDNAGFYVQHRSGDSEWEPVGFVEGIGSTEGSSAYEYRIRGLAPGRHTFRLEQVDLDGTTSYSTQVEVRLEHPGSVIGLEVFPRPAQARATVRVSAPRSEWVTTSVFDVLGRRISTLFSAKMDAGDVRSVVLDTGRFPAGLYVVRADGSSAHASTPLSIVR